MYFEQFSNTALSPDYSPNVRFMAFQSYLTAPHLFEQLNSIDCSFSGKTVADIGTGLGILLHLLKDKNPSKIIGIDIDKGSLNAARYLTQAKNTGYINANGFNMPVKDGAFDVVFARYVFQHVNLSGNFLSEIKRIIKDGGLLVIMDIEDDLNIFYPELPEAAEKLFRIYSEYQELKGGDRFISKKLPAFLAAGGLGGGFCEIEMKPYTFVFFKNKNDVSNSTVLKNTFLLVQNELELVKNNLLTEKLISSIEFYKGLNDYFKFLNSENNLLISKTEFLITCKIIK
ncbi:MAG: class I SAM-dependent methyltransferase [bacterium]